MKLKNEQNTESTETVSPQTIRSDTLNYFLVQNFQNKALKIFSHPSAIGEGHGALKAVLAQSFVIFVARRIQSRVHRHARVLTKNVFLCDGLPSRDSYM